MLGLGDGVNKSMRVLTYKVSRGCYLITSEGES